MPRWMAISAYTVDTPYEEEVKTLEASLNRYCVPYKIYPYKSKGDWWSNCEHNALIVQRAFRELDRNLVWIDADAELFAYPELFDEYKYDIGIYKRYHTQEQYEITGQKHHWDTGTMFMRNIPEVRSFMTVLHTPMHDIVDTGDGWILESFNKAVEAVIEGVWPHKLRIGTLPVTYSYIFNTKQPEEIKYKRKVVIRHNQASRRFRDEV